jgi:hypothetical protein
VAAVIGVNLGMNSIQTNRDLYLAIAELIRQQQTSTRSLEEYLRSLWEAARKYREHPSLTVDELFEVLAGAFTLPVPPFDSAWRIRYTEDFADVAGFGGWEARILRQVVDLHEMAEQGMLDDKMRYFGIDSPRGQRWYNFDPCSFLECATAGSYGGWQPGDDTGRDYVPGPVMAMGKDGQLEECDPREVSAPVVPIREVRWAAFQSFLGDGQWYE